MEGVFDKYAAKVWPHRYEGTLFVPELHGGTPSNPKVIEAWLRTKIEAKDENIRRLVYETMAQLGLELPEDAKLKEAALEQVAEKMALNMLKRDEDGLYIEGRQLKACIKEASNSAWPDRRWGATRKGTKSYVAEHFFVVEDRLNLGREEVDGISQRQVVSRFGASFTYEQFVTEVKIDFHLYTDADLEEEDWATLWLHAESLGIGASRSQGYGRFKLIRFDHE